MQDPSQTFINMFDTSFARILGETRGGRDFFETFYERFVGASPQVAEAFRHTDMDRQRSMLRKSFHYVVNFYVTTCANEALDRIARSHSRAGYDIAPELYDLWLETLMGVLRDFDPAYDGDVELAWRLVLSPGITYMKFHYDR